MNTREIIMAAILAGGSIQGSLTHLQRMGAPREVIEFMLAVIDAEKELLSRRGKMGSSTAGRPNIKDEVIKTIETMAAAGESAGKIMEAIGQRHGKAAVPSRATVFRYLAKARDEVRLNLDKEWKV